LIRELCKLVAAFAVLIVVLSWAGFLTTSNRNYVTLHKTWSSLSFGRNPKLWLCCTKPLMSEVPLSPDGFIPRFL